MKLSEKSAKRLDTFLTIFEAILIGLTIFSFIAVYPITIEGTSMYPTLDDGQYAITNKFKGKNHLIHRFDIVIIKLEDEKLIKRVIGLPNDTISYQNDCLYINGELKEEYFLDEKYKAGYEIFTKDFEITLKEDEYFCMGDNRPHSSDSRYYGPFSSSQIIACGCITFTPFDNKGFIYTGN